MSEKNTVKKLDYSTLINYEDGVFYLNVSPRKSFIRYMELNGHFLGFSGDYSTLSPEEFEISIVCDGCSGSLTIPSKYFNIDKLPEICDMLDSRIFDLVKEAEDSRAKIQERIRKSREPVLDFFKQRLGKQNE